MDWSLFLPFFAKKTYLSKKVADTIKFLLNERRKTVLCKIEKNREPLDERNFGGGKGS